MTYDTSVLLYEAWNDTSTKKQNDVILQVEPLIRPKLTEQLDIGIQISKLLNMMNDTMSHFLFYLFAILLVNGTTMAFAQTEIIFARQHHAEVFVNFFVFSILGGLYFAMLFRICTTGQDVGNASKVLKEAFEDAFLKSQNSYKIAEKTQFEIMIKKLEDASVISPCQAFNVNHSSFLGSMCLISTYLIVLTQFKVSEVSY